MQIPVTYDTAEKWCELALEFKLSEFKQAAEAICCGIQALVPQRSIALFTWDQLERAVCGEPDVGNGVKGMREVFNFYVNLSLLFSFIHSSMMQLS